jgi:hypothetical protein
MFCFSVSKPPALNGFQHAISFSKRQHRSKCHQFLWGRVTAYGSRKMQMMITIMSWTQNSNYFYFEVAMVTPPTTLAARKGYTQLEDFRGKLRVRESKLWHRPWGGLAQLRRIDFGSCSIARGRNGMQGRETARPSGHPELPTSKGNRNR